MSDEKPFKKAASKSAFGKNLLKELKRRQEAGQAGANGGTAAPAEDKPSLAADSFTRRLNKSIKESDSKPTSTEPQEPVETNTSPVGSGAWVCKEGDCIASIAKDTGHFTDTIWNDAGNTELREARKDPFVLLPGDRVLVPPLREKWVTKPAEMRHRFKRKGQPEMLKIRVLRDGEPRGNERYTIDIDGRKFQGTTDPDGKLSAPIVPNAKKAILRVGTEPDVTERNLLLGGVDPIDQVSGVQGRLNNLGFDCGAIDGVCGEHTQAAIRDYQRSRKLTVTGSPDESTRRQLQSDYGC